MVRDSARSVVITVAWPLHGRLTDIALHFTGFSEEMVAERWGCVSDRRSSGM